MQEKEIGNLYELHQCPGGPKYYIVTRGTVVTGVVRTKDKNEEGPSKLRWSVLEVLGSTQKEDKCTRCGEKIHEMQHRATLSVLPKYPLRPELLPAIQTAVEAN